MKFTPFDPKAVAEAGEQLNAAFNLIPDQRKP